MLLMTSILLTAGYVTVISKLGVPTLMMNDTGLDVTNPDYCRGEIATALAAGLPLF
ncbi:hypothetical protein [Mycobacterium leprae]|nr:hypothetical protein [Mycobacterium leprae]